MEINADISCEGGGTTKHWSIWKAIDKLEHRQKDNDFYPEITLRIIEVMKKWGSSDWTKDPKMSSLLNKSGLYHEIEETIVAVHFLFEGLKRRHSEIHKKCHVIDVCAGKGLFSLFLSYLNHPKIDSIIMLEKATIDWYHIHKSNNTAKEECRPEIIIWDNTNLHFFDDVLDRLLALPYPIAMCGIHLCKQLSPSFCGLSNGLGEKCIYGCLSPCCMPRMVTTQKKNTNKRKFTLQIQLAESVENRDLRRDYMLRRERLRRKPTGGPCFYCDDKDHSLLECTIVKSLPEEEQIDIRRSWHSATIPCWNCLKFGHFKNDCPNVSKDGITKHSSSHNAQHPPTVELDVTNILTTKNPYSEYCRILAADGFQQKQNWQPKMRVRVIETDLEKFGKHQEGNWNSGRKSTYIVVD